MAQEKGGAGMQRTQGVVGSRTSRVTDDSLLEPQQR